MQSVQEGVSDGKKASHKESVTLGKLQLKEDGKTWTGLLATTHPDRVNDILSKQSLEQIAHAINSDHVGGSVGSYRGISLFHDWVRNNEPSMDEAGYLLPGTAKVVPLEDGHYGVQADFILNEHYRGEMPAKEIEDRIRMGGIAGLSIEYDTDEAHSKSVSHGGEKYRFIESLTEFAGVGFARGRMIANPHAVIYKEIEASAEGLKMADEPIPVEQPKIEAPVVEAKDAEAKEAEAPQAAPAEAPQTKEQIAAHDVFLKEAVADLKRTIVEKLEVKSKVAIRDKEDPMTASISIKEMNDALSKNDLFQFKEGASHFFAENNAKYKEQMTQGGIPLNTTLSVKCDGTKLRIVGGLQVKDTLDTTTNTSSYTQNIVEFADVFLPGIVESFNQQINLFSQLQKVPHIEGGNKYGWRITTDQQTDLAVDPDDVVVNKVSVKKIKLQTPMCEYRIGVSVSDYTLFHSRASIGDLFMVEVEKRMKDLMHNINRDLFTEQVDQGSANKILGLEAVADSAGNTTLYGLTRSTSNRLAPASAGDTYNSVSGALTEALLRAGITKVEVEGAQRGDLMIVTSPAQRDVLFGLMASRQYLVAPNPAGQFGFANSPFGQVVYDGIPIVYDTQCPTDSLFIVDKSVFYIVMSRPPQLIGLAKVGAAEEAFISTYLASVYELPRRIYMLNDLT